MPVAAEVRLQLGHHDQVTFPDFDEAVTSGAQVLLAGSVRLNRGDDLYPERTAHSTSTNAARIVPVTMAMSTAVLRCWRNGLKPMTAS